MIESGARSLVRRIPEHLNSHFGQDVQVDLLTCYDGLPPGFSESTRVYRVTDFNTPEGRRELIGKLMKNGYSAAGMICSAESIMTRWKWMLFVRMPAKFFIVNENADYFWVHRDNSKTIRRFALTRLGLAGEGSLRTVGRLLVFPFALLWLIAFALLAHGRRKVRLALG